MICLNVNKFTSPTKKFTSPTKKFTYPTKNLPVRLKRYPSYVDMNTQTQEYSYTVRPINEYTSSIFLFKKNSSMTKTP